MKNKVYILLILILLATLIAFPAMAKDSKSKDNSKEIIDAVKGSPVLTVGEQAGFLENGGNINFLTVDHKIRFEINLDSANRNNLKIRSKLLKLAKRVINKDKSEGGKS